MGQITLLQVFIYSFIVFVLILIFIFILIRYHFNTRLHLQEEMNEKEREMEREVNQAKEEWSKEVADNISKELHDNVNQMLAIIRMQISNLEGKVTEPNYLQVITKVKNEISLTIESVRGISRILSKDNFDKFDFEQAILNQKDSIEMSSEIQFNLNLSAKPSEFIPKASQITLFRIIQESIHNSIKYSECTLLSLEFYEVDQKLQISISDNGKGFNAESTNNGLGLNHIVKRAEAIGAGFKLETSPGSGTKMLLSLPSQRLI